MRAQRGPCAQRRSGCYWNWELGRPPSAGTQNANGWLGWEQLRAAAQDKHGVASSLDGQDHGAHNVGAEKTVQRSSDPGCAQAPHPTAAASAGASTGQPNARKSCAQQDLGVQEKRQALWEPEDTHSVHQDAGIKIPSSHNILFRALNSHKTKEKHLKGSDPFSQIRQQRVDLELRGNSQKLAQVVNLCITNSNSSPTTNIFI